MIQNNRDEDVCRAWDVLADEVTPIECQNQNTFTPGKIGGSLSISQETIPNHFTPRSWRTHSSRCLTGNTKNGNRHPVLLPPGGNGENPGGLPKFKESR